MVEATSGRACFISLMYATARSTSAADSSSTPRAKGPSNCSFRYPATMRCAVIKFTAACKG
eukprot:7154550-Pyramimonas_sp.AAC.1